jgi:YD repeat-containing protein
MKKRGVLCVLLLLLARISHTFSGQIAALPIEIASQVGEDSVHATRPRPLERQDHRAECASCQRKCEKCGLAGIKTLPAQAASFDDQEVFDFQASEESDFADPPPPVFIPNELSTFNPQLPKVNIISGEYCEEECDLIVGGIEPLSYRRFYGHQEYKDKSFGHWRINPECQIFFNFEKFKTDKAKFHKFVGIGDESGSFFLYEKDLGNQCVLDPSNIKSFTNSTHLSGQKHPLNTKISFQRHKIKKEYSFSYTGVVEDGNGRKRFFTTEKGDWPTAESYGTLWKLPPHQAFVTEERKPNGNIIHYQYIDYNEGGGRCKYFILKSIAAYNSNKTQLLGSLDIHYNRSKNSRNVEQILVTGSDGRKAVLNHRVREVQCAKKIKKWGKITKRPKIVDVVLDHVISSWKPTQYYQYRWEHANTYFDAPFMFQAFQDDGRVFETSYDLGSKKVIAQNAPVGPNDQMAPIARYEYHNDNTVAYDGENNKTIYRFNGDKRITAIEKYQDNKLYSVEKSEYDPHTGNILKKTVENGSGQIFSLVEYVYDKNQNVTEERNAQDVITRTFTTDGFNLKETESDRPGKLIKYAYVPGTNLLTSEIVYANGKICKRTFHFYDDQISSVRVKTVIDDGTSEQPGDIASISYRRIIEISPKRTLPCVGLPEQLKEKTIDAYGNEILLKKVCYIYHPSGKIIQEDHYDANNTHCYSIINTYDEKERLVATTDPLGNTTTFKYDNTFNLIEQRGPRPDTHKEWVYDSANRPTAEKEWQTDGAILITKKKYDKTSRVIATIDECGFETRYDYDALGCVTAIHYPDGSIVQKVYDILGNVIQETDANGYTTNREYNFRGQPTAIYYPNGSSEHFIYNNNGGTLAEHVDPQGTKMVYTYDIFDHPLKVATYSAQGDLLKLTTATYSPFNKLSETDAEGYTIHYQYDLAGKKTKTQVNRGRQILYSYDTLGRLCQTQTADTLYTQLYDVKGQLTEKASYDLNGTLLEQECYTYDATGLLTHITNSKGTTETHKDLGLK